MIHGRNRATGRDFAFINSVSAILIWLPATAGWLQAGSQAVRQGRMRFEPGSCASE